MFDIAVIGAGPAGITAAVYAARKKLKTLVLTENIGGQAAWSGDIQNYTGYQFISGPELALKFEEHLKKFDIDLKENTPAQKIIHEQNNFKILTLNGEYSSKTVIIATGRKPRLLGVKGEKEYKNKGVTYCATCDGPLFSDKPVAIIGGGNSALDAALQMDKLTDKIYIINIAEKLTGDPVMIEKVKNSEKIKIYNSAQVNEIYGEKLAAGLKIKEKSGEEKDIKAQGVFIEIGSEPVLIPVLANEKLKLNSSGEIQVDDKCRANIKGLFAAGDVTSIPEKQIISSAGHGCIASLSAFKHLSSS